LAPPKPDPAPLATATAAPQALAAKYAGPKGRVHHRALLADLETAFTTAGMERDPASRTQDFTATLAPQGVELTAEMQAASDELIETLKHEVRRLGGGGVHRHGRVRSAH
jgi:hypothetical protein